MIAAPYPWNLQPQEFGRLDHSHTGGDGFQRRCPSCGGETSPTSHTDPRMSCDDCGDILPCCT